MSKTLEEIKATLSGVSLTLHGWSPARAFAPAEREKAATAVGARPKRVKARKEIIDVAHFAWRELTAVCTAARAWFDYATFPYVITGQRLFLRAGRDEIWEGADRFAAALREKARQLDANRAALLEEARSAMGETFDATLYPTTWEAEFSLEIREHSIEPPSYLAHTNAEEYRREIQRTIADVGASMQRFEQDCFRQMSDAAARLAANLGPDGRVMSANVAAFGKLFNRVASMQFEGTQVFRAALRDAQQILDGVGAEELRQSQGLRVETRGRLNDLMARYRQLQQTVAEKNQPAPEAIPEEPAPEQPAGIPDEVVSAESHVAITES